MSAAPAPPQAGLRLSELRAGAWATAPLVLGAIPLGIIFGGMGAAVGLSKWATLAISVFVYAGSAQLIALSLLQAQASLPLIFATTLVVNLRHLLYSASLVPHVAGLPQRWRALMGFALTDETFAAVSARFERPPAGSARWFFVGSWLAMHGGWVASTAVGIALGEAVPSLRDLGLDVAMSITFIGIISAYLRTRPMWAATLTSAGLSLLLTDLPHKLGLPLAGLAGVLVGLALSPRPPPDATATQLAPEPATGPADGAASQEAGPADPRAPAHTGAGAQAKLRGAR